MGLVQRLLAERRVGVMDAIIVTADLLGAGPGAVGEAKDAVLSSPARVAERERHRELVSDLLEAVEQIGDTGQG
jgi:hypothetical protein